MKRSLSNSNVSDAKRNAQGPECNLKPDLSFTGPINPLDLVRKWDSIPVSHARRYASDEES